MIIEALNGKTFSLRCDCGYNWVEDDRYGKAIMVTGIPSGADLCKTCGYYGWSMSQEKIDKIENAFKTEEKS